MEVVPMHLNKMNYTPCKAPTSLTRAATPSQIKINASPFINNGLISKRPSCVRAPSRKLCVHATADGGRNFQDEFQRKTSEFSKGVSDSFSDLFSKAKDTVSKFERDNDISGKARKAAKDARYKVEELTDDFKRQVGKIDREYKVSDKVKDVANLASDKFQETDEQFGLTRKWRAISADFKTNWPRYQKIISEFMATPIGKLLAAFFLSWLFLSGLLFQILFWGIWLFPLIPPLLRRFAENRLIQGACPACGFKFIGSKSNTLRCRRCSGIVWQARKDFSQDDSPIIDVDSE